LLVKNNENRPKISQNWAVAERSTGPKVIPVLTDTYLGFINFLNGAESLGLPKA